MAGVGRPLQSCEILLSRRGNQRPNLLGDLHRHRTLAGMLVDKVWRVHRDLRITSKFSRFGRRSSSDAYLGVATNQLLFYLSVQYRIQKEFVIGEGSCANADCR